MTPQQQAIIIDQSAQGVAQRSIAPQVGLSNISVHRAQHRPDIKAKIEAIRERVIQQASDESADNLIYAIKAYQVTPKDDPQLREHGFRASMRMAEAIGILPSHAPATYIQQIFEAGSDEGKHEIGALRDFLASRLAAPSGGQAQAQGDTEAQVIDIIPDPIHPPRKGAK